MQVLSKNPIYRSLIYYPLSLVFYGATFLRNLYYDLVGTASSQVSCMVISIGNITSGGTGKTPIAIYISSILIKKGYSTALLSRGYLRKTSGTVLVSKGEGPICKWEDCGDEAFMVSSQIKSVPIVVDNNRTRGANYIIKTFNPDIIILDDAFQHRSIRRNMDIVLINGNDTVKDHKLLPYGTLREPWGNIKRSNMLFITKQKANTYLNKKLEQTQIPIFETKTINYISRTYNFSSKPIDKNKDVFLISGIADSSFFIKTVEELGFSITGHSIFQDHFNYSKKNILDIEKKARAIGADYIITTEKDWVKIIDLKPTYRIIVINIKFELLNEERFINLVDNMSKSVTFPKQKQHQQR